MSSNQPMRLPQEVPEEVRQALDPQTDPSVADQAQNLIAAANAPEEVDAPNLPHPNVDALSIDLPVGVVDIRNGELLHTAEVRELNGEDEEYFQRGKHFQDRKSRIIERATVSLGGEEPTKALLKDLTVGDRETILLGISRATYGDRLPLPTLTCPKCQDQHNVEVDLVEDIEIREKEGPTETFTFRDGGTVEFHWPTGEDERAIWDYGVKKRSATDGEMNTQMLARVVEAVDGEPWFGEQSAKKMGLARRHELLTFISENAPGPRYDKIEHACPECGHEADLEVAFTDLFR